MANFSSLAVILHFLGCAIYSESIYGTFPVLRELSLALHCIRDIFEFSFFIVMGPSFYFPELM